MAKKFKAKSPEQWLPAWLKGRGITPVKVRCTLKDGSKIEFDPNQPFEIEDERALRHLEADTRFDKMGA